MRTVEQVDAFQVSMLERYGANDAGVSRAMYYTRCYEACIPKTFWNVTSQDIRYNVDAFNGCVLHYTARMKLVLRRGYSLLFTGDNGAGKSIFISFILTQAIRRGRTAYYTTLSQLDADIKRGFQDKQADARLVSLLDSDFVAIDEVGKEHYKADGWLMSQLELFLKRRYDDGEPVLLATNLMYPDVTKMYGPSVESMLEGRYTVVPLESGDYRRTVKAKMKQELGI